MSDFIFLGTFVPARVKGKIWCCFVEFTTYYFLEKDE